MLTEATARGQMAAARNRQTLENGGPMGEEPGYEVTCPSSRGAVAQSLVAGAVLLLMVCCGTHDGYSAILLPQLKADNSTLPTDEELGSWIASVHAIGTPFGVFLGGLLMDRWGCRRTLILSSVPFAASWTILTFATNHVIILTARVLAGFSSGLCVWPTQLVARDTTEARTARPLPAMAFLSHSLGILLVYVLGAVMNWNVVSAVSTAFPLLSLGALVLLPEGPVRLVKTKAIQEAEKGPSSVRGGSVGSQAKRELHHLMATFGPRNATTTSGNTCCQQVYQPHILKPLFILGVFYLTQIMSGTYVLMFYAVDIVTQAGTSDGLGLDSVHVAVLTATDRLLFAVFVYFLLSRIGRRPLLLTAGSLQTISALSVGTFLYIKDVIDVTDYEFPGCKPIIAVSMLAYVAANTCSYYSAPEIVMAEILPPHFRSHILAGSCLGVFVTTKFFPWLCDMLGLHGAFCLFGVTTAIGTFAMYLLLPESRGKSPLQMEGYFCQPNILWVGRNMALRGRRTTHRTCDYEMQTRS